MGLYRYFLFCLSAYTTTGFSPAATRRGPWGLSPSSRKNAVVVPFLSTTTTVHDDPVILSSTMDELSQVRILTETAIKYTDQEKGYAALRQLADLCNERLPFEFDWHGDGIGSHIQDDNVASMAGSIVSRIPNLLPQNVTRGIFETVDHMVQNGWISTNPDSVDGLPSFHINLVIDGKPLFRDASQCNDEHDEGFRKSIHILQQLVQPHLYDVLLPKVNHLLNATDIRISDVFLRRYGTDLVDGESRLGISAHYDVFSRVTSVIALDDTASDGRNGLYTTVQSAQKTTSNHASLRRFFPLNSGDAVVHTWDVLHGVSVEPGLERTSLIVWFTSEDQLNSFGNHGSPRTVSPWLVQHEDLSTNGVVQFVLAGALESAEENSKDPRNGSHESMHFSSAGCTATTIMPALHPHTLYLESASRGNTFALTRVGTLCENGDLSSAQRIHARKILHTLEKAHPPPPAILIQLSEDENESMNLAKRFWYQGAIWGNPLSQMALADQIMSESANDPDAADSRWIAATLFVLAAQQGQDEAVEKIYKMIDLELSLGNIESEQDFQNSPIVKMASTHREEICEIFTF